MQLELLKPNKTLNKAYLKEKTGRAAIELFKGNLSQLHGRINEDESEEHLKNVVSDFLKDTWYKNVYEINTKDRKDLVIHTGKTTREPVGVILEVKKPSNKTEMVSGTKPNAKALHEMILYYLRETIDQQSKDIKYLIITNIYEWYIFDEIWFLKNVFRNTKLKKEYESWKLSGKDTRFFYENIARPFLDEIDETVECTYFDIRDYKTIISNSDQRDDKKLIALYKILSPEHLLKQRFANDSNSLDTKFYSELLYIIGLEEVKDGGKKLIRRKANPEHASLLENALLKIMDRESLDNVTSLTSFGHTADEQSYNIALELCITWINRILFLKLLEAQLFKYHKADKDYLFLNTNTIHDFDELSNLFFQVLAEKTTSRRKDLQNKFSRVPYLNSSLFDRTVLEKQTIDIGALDNRMPLPIQSLTVLKDEQGKRKTGSLTTLQYLFAFLDAYDFTSDGAEEIQEDNKNLINASVLGLIFEKINGYKDGSFFTPGFVTMYMCRETIRRAVLQKFNDAKSWHCGTIDDLHNKIEDKKEANAIINSITICDPAVGSGHFLVSALNEMIAIKSELKVLLDRQGKSLKDYEVEVVNDELITSDENGLLDYKPNNRESQRVQEALFHEKQTIIENCLFGVDINPNSVKICRLRLWIELLKSAYYIFIPTAPNGQRELETLPNIDINIKCGNSLVSRFALDADIKNALRKSKWNIDSYKVAVRTYRDAESKEQKKEMESLIDTIKKDFRSEISINDKKFKTLNKLRRELLPLIQTIKMFEDDNKTNKENKRKIDILTKQISKQEHKIEEIKSNKIYDNAFEWRFEFPEVLNNDGVFVGFDVVIGNPPYIRIQDLNGDKSLVDYYNSEYYSTGSGNYDLYIPFIELGYNIMAKGGEHCYIMPHKFTNAKYGEKIREFITRESSLRKFIHFGATQVFEDATTYTGLFFFDRKKNMEISFFNCDDFNLLKNNSFSFETISSESLSKNEWMFVSGREAGLLTRLIKEFKPLENLTERIFQGLKTSADKIFILEKISEAENIYEVFCRENEKKYFLEKGILFPMIKGGNSRAFEISGTNLLILFPYIDGQLIDANGLSINYPNAWKYLNEHKSNLEKRENGNMLGNKWYAYGRNQAIEVINKPKLFTPDIAPNPRVSYDSNGVFMFTGGVSGGYGITPKNTVSPLYLLAILNSKVAFWFIKKISTQMRGGWYSFESRYIKNIPIPFPVGNVKEIEALVNKATDGKKNNIDITEYEEEINKIIYALYDLTEEEIGVVER